MVCICFADGNLWTIQCADDSIAATQIFTHFGSLPFVSILLRNHKSIHGTGKWWKVDTIYEIKKRCRLRLREREKEKESIVCLRDGERKSGLYSTHTEADSPNAKWEVEPNEIEKETGEDDNRQWKGKNEIPTDNWAQRKATRKSNEKKCNLFYNLYHLKNE